MADAYKHLIPNVNQTVRIYEHMNNIRANLIQVVPFDPAMAPVLREVSLIFDRYAAQMNAAAVSAAQFADHAITALVRATTLRPPTGHVPGLAGSIKSGVGVRGTFVSFAIVEVAWVSELNKVINPFATRGAGQKPYWWSQEYGNSKNVGREIQGLFYGGGAASAPPNATLFRVHPLFAAGKGGKGVINNAIDAKWFLRDGTQETITYWSALIAQANATAVARLSALPIP